MSRLVTTIYQLKMVLEGIRPQIWRRVVVPADLRLSHLHDVFQITMGWTDSHLHAFTIEGVQYTMPYEETDLDMEDERRVRLSSLVPAVGTLFQYQYDFGDDWQHAVQVEKIRPADPDTPPLSCLAGKHAGPPEDCGGIPGYAQLLRILKNPRHPEYGEMRQWAGRRFDPEAFDPEAVNKKLHRLRV
jgi:hypothetical protein